MVMGNDTPGGGLVQEVTLFSPGPSIYGGTDQVQRNIIGERVLGLPKEPGSRQGHAVQGAARQPLSRCSTSCSRRPVSRSAAALGSTFGFLALHGGLEAHTAEIAHAAAIASNASFYAVVQPDDLRWHVPSHAYDPAQSDALDMFVDHVETVVSVHGFGGLRGSDDRWVTGLLGGSNRPLAARPARPCSATRCPATTGSTTSM